MTKKDDCAVEWVVACVACGKIGKTMRDCSAPEPGGRGDAEEFRPCHGMSLDRNVTLQELRSSLFYSVLDP